MINIKSINSIENNLICLIEGRNFFFQFDLAMRRFVEYQKYLSAEINYSLEYITTGGFGNIGQSGFTAFAYNKVNEIMPSIQSAQKLGRVHHVEPNFYVPHLFRD